MKYQKVKIALIALCVLAAGICYGLSRDRETRLEGISLSEESAFQENMGTKASGDGGTGGQGAAGDPSVSATESPLDGETAEGSLGSTGGKTSLSFYVHICGEVVSPGVYELLEGSRVYQAVEKAGGFTEKAAAESLNMAERVTDGMKLVVLSKEEAETAAARIGFSGGASSGTGKPKVNLNTAPKEELMTLRGIGEAKADAIIKYRESRGGFQKIEDIMKISGIKDAAFQKIKEDIMV